MQQRKKYQVFVSSTFEDLKEIRKELINSLIRQKYIVIGMEDFFSKSSSQWNHIEREINESDYYILILGHRYGSIDPETQISYTEKEFEYAKSIGVPTLVFELSRNFDGLDPNIFERDSTKFAKLNSFKEKVQNLLLSPNILNQQELDYAVMTSLRNEINDHPRPGWIRNNMTDISALQEENLKLKAEIASLKSLSITNIYKLPDLKFHLDLPHINKLPEKKLPKSRSSYFLTSTYSHLEKYLNKTDISKYNDSIPTQDQLDRNNEISYQIECLTDLYPVEIVINNVGNKKASDVRVKITFPDFVRIFDSSEEYDSYVRSLTSHLVEVPVSPLKKAEEQYNKDKNPFLYDLQKIAQGAMNAQRLNNNFSGLLSNRYLSRDDENYVVTINDSTGISIRRESIVHAESQKYICTDKLFLAPLKVGKGEVVVSLICDEFDKEEIYRYPLEVIA